MPINNLRQFISQLESNVEPVKPSRSAWRAVNVTDFTDDIINDRGTGRVAVDATGCRVPRPEVTISVDAAALVARRWKECGFA